MIEYNILKIVPDTVVDGPGLRTSVYFAGCSIHCPGCHNPESWDFNQGTKYSLDELIDEIESYGHKKVTLTGGNPVEQPNLDKLCNALKEKGFDIWLYMGYKLDNRPKYMPNVDVIVDGPFVQELKNDKLMYRGSSNQRIIKRREFIWYDASKEYDEIS